MQVYVLGCPLCQQQFQVSAGDLGEVLLCPHCRQPVRIPETFDPKEGKAATASKKKRRVKHAEQQELPLDDEDAFFPSIEFEPVGQKDASDQSVEGLETGIADSIEDDTVDPTANLELSEWLPPKFEIPDPSKLRDRATANQVLLPSADGGVQSIDQRYVTVEYKGKKYTLVALSPEQKKRRQLIVNLVSIVIAMIAIWATFKILTW